MIKGEFLDQEVDEEQSIFSDEESDGEEEQILVMESEVDNSIATAGNSRRAIFEQRSKTNNTTHLPLNDNSYHCAEQLPENHIAREAAVRQGDKKMLDGDEDFWQHYSSQVTHIQQVAREQAEIQEEEESSLVASCSQPILASSSSCLCLEEDAKEHGKVNSETFQPISDSIIPAHKSCKDAIPRITPQTLISVLDNPPENLKLRIVDCRYEYEWAGGHIPGSLNVSKWDAAARSLFFSQTDNDNCTDAKQIVVWVLHCEFSSERAPRMALTIRNHDRSLNTYPHLRLPHLFVMEGGYRAFWQSAPHKCSPPYHYRPMRHALFKPQLRASLSSKSKNVFSQKQRDYNMVGETCSQPVSSGSNCFIVGRQKLRSIRTSNSSSSSTTPSELH